MEGRHWWEQCRDGRVPERAVHAGVDKDNSTIYVGRAYHEGDLLPAKVTPSHGCAYVSWGGREIKKFEYEVLLCHKTGWEEDRDGRVPRHAIPIGKTSSGEELFLGRTMYQGTLTPGKIHPSNRCLYIPYDGKEIRIECYEVLVNRHGF